ncbi:phosphodiesterase [Quadrisphaera oryzae]|uniref:phosphodiesterase n=1 Tax=Quadrisphaera TaxID=317661 RepID=UPI0016448A07|nr:phosphodiesterase [Quadrisphaera sp. RL12-1S]
MLLAHLSDPHLPSGALAAGPARALHTALGRTAALDVDAVVVTGDLVDRGTPQEYAVLREVLDDAARSMRAPVLLAAGNHDDADALVAAFGGTPHLGGGASTRYAVDLPGARLLVLDSAVRGQGAGRLGAEQLTWLRAELAAHPDTPALLALHHPPTPVGVPFLDGMGLEDAGALAVVVAEHRQVVRVLAGHVHRSTTAAFAGTVAVTAPSTWRQSALDLTVPGRMGYLDEPSGLLLHQLDERTGGLCVTHAVPVEAAAPLFPVPR